jgi:hypothetical protein
MQSLYKDASPRESPPSEGQPESRPLERSKLLKSCTKYWILFMLSFMGQIGQSSAAPTITATIPSQSTGNTGPTYAGSISSAPSTAYTTEAPKGVISSSRLSIFAHSSSTTSTRVFIGDENGYVKASDSSTSIVGMINTISFCDDKIYARVWDSNSIESKACSYKINYNSGTYTLSGITCVIKDYNNVQQYALGDWPLTNYAYVLGWTSSTTTSILFKYDMSKLTLVLASSSFSFQNPIKGGTHINDEFFLFFKNSVVIGKKIDISLFKTLTQTAAPSTDLSCLNPDKILPQHHAAFVSDTITVIYDVLASFSGTVLVEKFKVTQSYGYRSLVGLSSIAMIFAYYPSGPYSVLSSYNHQILASSSSGKSNIFVDSISDALCQYTSTTLNCNIFAIGSGTLNLNIHNMLITIDNTSISPICQVPYCDVCTTAPESKCDKCKSGFALKDSLVCVNIMSLPDYVGINTATTAITNCAVTNCIYCKFDYTTCTKCDPAITPQLYLASSTSCALVNTLNGSGYNSLTGGSSPCADTNCQFCQNDYNKCTNCKYPLTPQRYLFQGRCALSTDLPDGYGADNSDYTSKPCSMAGCGKCQTLYTQCTACIPQTPPVYYYSATSACLTVSSIPTGYGANLGTLVVVACQDPNCNKCQSDYTICTKCKVTGVAATENYLYLGSCYTTATLPSGFGPSTSGGINVAKACTDSNCAKCLASLSTCTDCRVASPQYFAYNGNCVLPRDLPLGTGAILVNKQTSACQEPTCYDCRDDYTKCVTCKNNISPQTYLSTDTCKLPTSLPDGYGANLATLVSTICVDAANCLKCQQNYLQCTNCKPGSSTYMYQGLCTPYTSLPSGVGANTPTLIAEPCTDTNCDDCKANKNTCVKCKASSTFAAQYFANGGVCVLAADLPSGVGPDLPNYVAKPCQNVDCDDCKSSYTECKSCKIASPQKFAYQNLCQLPTSLPDGIGANLATRAAIGCSNNLCMKCQADYTQCTKCKTTTPPAPHYYLGNNHCVLASSLPDGMGADTVNYVTKPCTEPNCKDCQYDYTTCISCKITNNPLTQRFLLNHLCKLPSELTGTDGANLVTYGVKTCLDSQCSKCQNDYTKCESCKIASGSDPQFYLLDGYCILPDSFPPGYGADISTKTMVPCSDPNCDDCRTNKNICDLCKRASSLATQYYTYQGGCYLSGSLPDGYGANPITLISMSCPNNCRLCKEDYTVCIECYQSPSRFYVYNGLCISLSSIPAGFGAGPAPEYKALACSDIRCKDCKNDYTVCVACTTTPLVYYLHVGDKTCYLVWQIPVGYGPKLSGNIATTQLCSVPNCAACQIVFNQCTKCMTSDPPMFLHSGSCVLATNLPDKFGGNPITYMSAVCSVSDCKDCRLNFRTCNECAVINGRQKYLDTIELVCVFASDMASGYGPNLITKEMAKCIVDHCDDCKTDYNICSKCDEANGWILRGDYCYRVSDFYLEKVDDRYRGPNSDIVAQPRFEINYIPSVEKQLIELIFKELNLSIVVTPKGSDREIPATFQLFKVESVILLSVHVIGPEYDSQDLSLITLTSTPFGTEIDGKYMGLRLYESEMRFTREPDYKFTQAPFTYIKYITYYPTAINTPTGLGIMGGLLALDPTGTFFRFTKILQIVNKLYFININYGKRLEAFLDQSVEYKYEDPLVSNRQLVYNSKYSRGKLDKRNVPMSFLKNNLLWGLIYLFSWIFKILFSFKFDQDCAMGKIGIYFCHYANKVHLIIFNLVFIDFIWLAPRTLLHSRGMPLSDIVSAGLMVFLCATDLCLILAHLLDDRIWSKAYMHYSRLAGYRQLTPEELVKENKDMGMKTEIDEATGQVVKNVWTVNKSALNLRLGNQNKAEEPKPERQINYKKTYFEIDFNVHLMDYVGGRMCPENNPFRALLPRLLLGLHWVRVPILELSIITLQHFPSLALSTILAFEAFRLIGGIYAYLKYKYLKNIICLLMDLSSPFFLCFFYANALLISPKRFDEIIMDFYQDAGIWIVIASCVAEYLLLITYIAVAAYEFFKNRKMMKKMNVKPEKYSVIVYNDAPEKPADKPAKSMKTNSVGSQSRLPSPKEQDNDPLNTQPNKLGVSTLTDLAVRGNLLKNSSNFKEDDNRSVNSRNTNITRSTMKNPNKVRAELFQKANRIGPDKLHKPTAKMGMGKMTLLQALGSKPQHPVQQPFQIQPPTIEPQPQASPEVFQPIPAGPQSTKSKNTKAVILRLAEAARRSNQD